MFYQDDIVHSYLVKINILPGTDCFFQASCNINKKKKKKNYEETSLLLYLVLHTLFLCLCSQTIFL